MCWKPDFVLVETRCSLSRSGCENNTQSVTMVAATEGWHSWHIRSSGNWTWCGDQISLNAFKCVFIWTLILAGSHFETFFFCKISNCKKLIHICNLLSYHQVTSRETWPHLKRHVFLRIRPRCSDRFCQKHFVSWSAVHRHQASLFSQHLVQLHSSWFKVQSATINVVLFFQAWTRKNPLQGWISTHPNNLHTCFSDIDFQLWRFTNSGTKTSNSSFAKAQRNISSSIPFFSF